MGIFYFYGLPSHEVYSISLHLLKIVNLGSLYEDDFQKTFKMVKITQKLIEKYHPDLANLIKKLNIKLDIVIMKWFLTGFSDFLSLQEVRQNLKIKFLSLVVNLLEHGLGYLACLAVAIFGEYKGKREV